MAFCFIVFVFLLYTKGFGFISALFFKWGKLVGRVTGGEGEGKGGGRLCKVNSWGEPDLKVAANITLYKIPVWIPAVIMHSVLPSTVCTKESVIICIFEFHMHFYSFVSVSNFSSSICFIRIGSLLWAGGKEILAQNNMMCLYLSF